MQLSECCADYINVSCLSNLFRLNWNQKTAQIVCKWVCGSVAQWYGRWTCDWRSQVQSQPLHLRKVVYTHICTKQWFGTSGSITTFLQVPNYTAWLQRQVCMSGFLPGSLQPVRVKPLGYFLNSCVGSPSDVCQPLDRIIICRVKSGQTAFQLHQRASVDSVRHRLGLGHRSMDPPTSLLASAISFYRRPQWPSCAVQKQFSIDHCCQERSKLGWRALCLACPVTWNSLPLDIHSIPTLSTFKNMLKTSLVTFLIHWLNVSQSTSSEHCMAPL